MTLEWMGEHPILTFMLAYIAAELALKVLIRTLRTINVTARGWPPAHLDADGDWKPEREDEQ